jgi:hypothetical protein
MSYPSIRILNPPTPDMFQDDTAHYRFLLEIYNRTGGSKNTGADLSGLTASVRELNTLEGVKIDTTVQTQLNGITGLIAGISVTPPLHFVSYNLYITQADAKTDGYLKNTDWAIFNAKEPAITPGTTAQYYRGDKSFQTLDTKAVPENTNLYYTDARARAAISETVTGLDYNNVTGVLSQTTGYVIPTTTEEKNWNDAYAKEVSTWTSPLQYAAGTASIVQSNSTTDGYLRGVDFKSFDTTINITNDIATVGTMYPVWVNAITGKLVPYVSNTKLSFNPSTGTLTATAFSGAFSGTATNADNIGVTDDIATNATMYPLWVTANTGYLPGKVSSTKLSFNPSTGLLTSTGFSGSLTGNVTGNCSGSSGTCTGNAGSATYASASTITDDIATAATMYPVWVTANTGNIPSYVSSTKLSFVPSTGILTSTGFSGALTGNVTGNCSGSSGTCTGNAGSSTYSSASTIADDVATDADMYPTWVTANTGNLPIKVSSTQIKYHPSTGLYTLPKLSSTDTTEATTGGAGAIVTSGGIYSTKAIISGSATEATTGAAGSIITAGGIYATKAIINGSTTDSSSTTTGALITAGGAAIAKKLYVGTGIYLATTGGTAAELNNYEEYSYVTTFTNSSGGTLVTTANITFSIVRIGKQVTITQISPYNPTVTTSAASQFTNSTFLPARFRPSNLTYFAGYAESVGTFAVSAIRFNSTGEIVIFYGNLGAFGIGANTGWLGFSFTYNIS